MLKCMTIRLAGIALIVASVVPAAFGYIHFPPMTLRKMCDTSHQIRFLKVTKCSKEKGVIIFEVTESPKSQKSEITSFKHVLRANAEGVPPILDWVQERKSAVMFSIETKPGMTPTGLGYVFIDNYCYSVGYNSREKYWLLIRAEPAMSACYHGSVEQLRALVKETLSGKQVKVPVKDPDRKDDGEKRKKEVNQFLERNR